MKDLFGNEIQDDVILREKFLEPPFSVLDTKTESWQRRKKLWNQKGIKSEEGRGQSLTHHIPYKSYKADRMAEEYYSSDAQAYNTSIFDPALCELIYHWFCPPGGKILDPFAGGSVRGIVAGYLGFQYVGIELRAEQVEANRKNAAEILSGQGVHWFPGDSEKVLPEISARGLVDDPGVVRISVPMLKQRFQPCEPVFIREVCHGRCCEGTDGILVTVHPTEEDRVLRLGGAITAGRLEPAENGLCPFKDSARGLCTIHDQKPFGCAASPFTLNEHGTLVVRNCYRLLRCYNTEAAVPAYQAHRWSLNQIFGKEEVDRIVEEVEAGAEEVFAKIDPAKRKMLVDNDLSKHPDRATKPEFDLLFTCPPYMNLEVYSDDPDDLSNMSDADFVAKYERILALGLSKVKPDGTAVIVVGEVRDKKTGFYKGFLEITKTAFAKAGWRLYNDLVLLNPVGSASMRAGRQFTGGRKVVKIHQNVLVFKKEKGGK